MFTRPSSAEPRTLEPLTTNPSRSNAVQHRTGPSEGGKSVIGNDLRIIGQGLKIISQGCCRSMERSRVTCGPPRSSSASKVR